MQTRTSSYFPGVGTPDCRRMAAGLARQDTPERLDLDCISGPPHRALRVDFSDGAKAQGQRVSRTCPRIGSYTGQLQAATIFYCPTRGVRQGNMKEARAKAGMCAVSVKGADNGSGPGVFRVRVVVE